MSSEFDAERVTAEARSAELQAEAMAVVDDLERSAARLKRLLPQLLQASAAFGSQQALERVMTAATSAASAIGPISRAGNLSSSPSPVARRGSRAGSGAVMNELRGIVAKAGMLGVSNDRLTMIALGAHGIKRSSYRMALKKLLQVGEFVERDFTIFSATALAEAGGTEGVLEEPRNPAPSDFFNREADKDENDAAA